MPVNLFDIYERISLPLLMGIELVVFGIIYFKNVSRRDKFELKLPVVLIIFVTLCVFAPNFALFGIILTAPIFIYLLGAIACAVLFNDSVKTIVFCALATLVSQHIAITLTDITRIFMGLEIADLETLPVRFLCVLLTFIVCYFVFEKLLPPSDYIVIASGKLLGISGGIFTLIYLLRVIAVDLVNEAGFPIIQMSFQLYGLVGSIICLVLLFSVNKVDRLEVENEMMEQMMQSREKQYIFAGENIELINMKCHDLKHQITRIRKEMEDARKDEALKEIEDAIQIYDHVAKTGCEALDTLLTEKGLYCDSYGISLNYMVDGEILSWMKSADIYSLFGNAIDNAIEAVIEEKEPEKRIITLQVFEKMSYLCIHMENYSGFAVRFEDGLPITRKKDKKYHGFGLKSMKYVVKKYKGTMTMEQKNQIFYLDILIPLTK